MQEVKLYRRRFIPDEKVLLKDDKIIYKDENKIITKWEVLKPRKDFNHGASCYLLDEGFKISKFIDKNDNILYWYCDIINWNYNKENNEYIFNDLLIDVIICNNGFVKVVDMAEIAIAIDKKLITIDTAKDALIKTDKLLNIIYNGNFENYKKYIMDI